MPVSLEELDLGCLVGRELRNSFQEGCECLSGRHGRSRDPYFCCFSSKIFFIYFQRDRKEKERERHTNVWLLLVRPLLET